jgi:hypothetical protein
MGLRFLRGLPVYARSVRKDLANTSDNRMRETERTRNSQACRI